MLDIGYGSVGKMLRARCEAAGAKVVVGKISFPTTRDQMVADAVAGCPQDCALAVIDHIASNTGICLPVQEIVEGIRAKCGGGGGGGSSSGCRILIDGAHGLASQELSMRALKPDYYITNCHK
jgi:selenocysteine lyase/cysteine desulfurase